VTVTAGVAVLVLAVTRAGDTLRVAEPAVLILIAAVLLGGFIVQERRAASPLVDLALFEDRRVLGANLSLLGMGGIIGGEALVLTLYLQEGRGLSALVTGRASSPRHSARSRCPVPRQSWCPRLDLGACLRSPWRSGWPR